LNERYEQGGLRLRKSHGKFRRVIAENGHPIFSFNSSTRNSLIEAPNPKWKEAVLAKGQIKYFHFSYVGKWHFYLVMI
jgi:hypothetical protein